MMKSVTWLLLGGLLIGTVVMCLFGRQVCCCADTQNAEPAGPISKGRVVEQAFVAEDDGLQSVKLIFATYMRRNVGHLVLSVIDLKTRSELLNRVIDMEELEDNVMKEFDFSPQWNSKGRRYLVRISGVDGMADSSATTYLARGGRQDPCVVDGHDQRERRLVLAHGYRLIRLAVWNAAAAILSFSLLWLILVVPASNRRRFSRHMPRIVVASVVAVVLIRFSCEVSSSACDLHRHMQLLKVAFGGGTVLLSVLVSAVCTAICRKVPYEWIFLMIFLPMTMAMSFCMPPSCVPDEGTHFIGTYVVASGQFVRTSNEIKVPRGFTGSLEQSTATVRKAIRSLHSGEDWSCVFEADRYGENGAVYPPMAYLPQALFMRIGAFFYHNYMFAFYAARMGSILMTAFLLFLAIRMTPVGKDLFLYAALLPMALQETASASADGMAVSSVALCTAFYLKFVVTSDVVRTRHAVLAAFLMGALVSFKVMYLPFAFLLFMLPLPAFEGCRSRRLRFRIVALSSLLLTILIWWVLSILPLLHSPVAPRANHVMDNLQFWMAHLQLALEVICRTLYQYASFWFVQMIGWRLAFQDLFVADIVLVLLVFAGGFAFWNERVACAPDKRGRRGLICCSGVCAFVVIVTLWLWWTPMGSARIEGVQGRYFLPMLAPFLIACRGGRDNEQGQVRHWLGLSSLLVVADVCALACVLAAKWV